MAQHQSDLGSEASRPRWGLGFVAVAAVLVLAGGIWAWNHFKRAENADDGEKITTSSDRLTLEKDGGDNLKVVDRKDQPELWYRVTLEDAPIGRVLDLTCEWIDPDKKIAHRNRYKTKEITKTPWPTYARYRFVADAKPGTWKVRLLLGDQELCVRTFEVRDGKP